MTATLPSGTPLTVFGRTPAGDWVQVRSPDRSGGWVSAGLVALGVAVDRIPVASEIPAAPAAGGAAAERSGVVAAPGGVGAVQIVDLQPSGDDEVVVVRNAGGTAVT